MHCVFAPICWWRTGMIACPGPPWWRSIPPGPLVLSERSLCIGHVSVRSNSGCLLCTFPRRLRTPSLLYGGWYCLRSSIHQLLRWGPINLGQLWYWWPGSPHLHLYIFYQFICKFPILPWWSCTNRCIPDHSILSVLWYHIHCLPKVWFPYSCLASLVGPISGLILFLISWYWTQFWSC